MISCSKHTITLQWIEGARVMNKRLSDMMNEAMPVVDWKARYGVELNNGERNKWYADWFDNFANLIIEENIRYINEEYQRDFNTLWREDLTKGIKEHFGIEETKEVTTYQSLVDAGIIRTNERDLEGEEYTIVRKALAGIMPYKTTNNQRSITEYYKMNDLEYHLTVLDGDPPDVLITEVKPK